jgi:hypothetical protein
MQEANYSMEKSACRLHACMHNAGRSLKKKIKKNKNKEQRAKKHFKILAIGALALRGEVDVHFRLDLVTPKGAGCLCIIFLLSIIKRLDYGVRTF